MKDEIFSELSGTDTDAESDTGSDTGVGMGSDPLSIMGSDTMEDRKWGTVSSRDSCTQSNKTI